MEKNGIVKRILAVALLVIAVIGLTMQETSVFAESLQPEKQTDLVQTEQSEDQTVTTEGQSVSQNELPEEKSVSQNDISGEETEEQNGTIAELADIDDMAAENKLTDAILKQCIVKGMNPPGVTVNLFDYSQGIAADGSREVAHDYYYKWSGNNAPIVGTDPYVTTYNLGISKNHLLRFGYRGKEENDYCIQTLNGMQLGDYGEWNENHTGRYPGIVQNKLYNGFPKLNLTQKDNYGRYADETNRADYLTDEKKSESLAYLFSPSVQNQFKASYTNVQGLFQRGVDGYYYYNSKENFVSFNRKTKSFTLYNSAGVAYKTEDGNTYYGQFFPFNEVRDVFDEFYMDGSSYRLTYNNNANNHDGNTEDNFEPITNAEGHGYIKCYAPNLNHYLGLTLEMRFVQPVDGCVVSDTDKSDEMIFRFSGDDDVWIFIDDVLVADLGGLHGALELTINFATGMVTVDGNRRTLYDFFVDAYGEDSIPGNIKFSEVNGNTFADNTTHTLKMFYLERGHMASNLSLSFNIQPLPSEKPKKEPPNDPNVPDEDTDENEDSASDSTQGNTSAEERIISTTDNMVVDSTGIPQTGDDSLIWWWGVLCIVSLVGIGATVCNLMIRKRKQKKSSSKK